MAPNWCNVIFRDLMCRPKYLVSFSHIYKVEVKIFKFEDEKMMIFAQIWSPIILDTKIGHRYLTKLFL